MGTTAPPHARKLGAELSVPPIGLGCMGMSYAYGPTDHDEAVATVRSALDLGMTFLDTADTYAQGENGSIRRLHGPTGVAGSPDYVRPPSTAH